jgi:hypothetical protein
MNWDSTVRKRKGSDLAMTPLCQKLLYETWKDSSDSRTQADVSSISTFFSILMTWLFGSDALVTSVRIVLYHCSLGANCDTSEE